MKRTNHLLSLLLLLASLVIAFLSVELFVRLFLPEIDLHALTGEAPRPKPISTWAVQHPYAAYRAKPGTNFDGKTVNSAGFISTPEIMAKKDRGSLRIAYLGGSSTAGTGISLPDEETWPWIATRLLADISAQPIDFVNAAASGYSSFDSFGLLWSRLRFYRPDVVVIYHGWNEMYYFSHFDRIHDWRILEDGEWNIDRQVRVASLESEWFDRLISWSELLSFVRVYLSVEQRGEVNQAAQDAELASGFDGRALEIWRGNLRLLKLVTEEIGADLYVAKQATLIVPGLPEEDRKRCRYEYHGFDHDAHVAAFSGIYDIIDEEIPSDRIIDLTSLSGVSEYFHDHIHPTPKGARKIGRMVAQRLKEEVRSSP